MFEVDNPPGRGVISGVVCGCDEHCDCAVESEESVLALCRPIWNEKEGTEDNGG